MDRGVRGTGAYHIEQLIKFSSIAFQTLGSGSLLFDSCSRIHNSASNSNLVGGFSVSAVRCPKLGTK